MLIKKHQLPAAPSSSPPANTPDFANDDSNAVVAPIPTATPTGPTYTEGAVESGQLPERRVNQSSYDDRRRGYRRIEDRHLISKAHEEARQIKEQAYEEGLEKGLLRVADEMAELRAQFDALLATRTAALATLTDDIAPIAVEIAERLIKVELSCDEELVNTIVEDTLQKLDRNSKSVLIKVNPADKARVKAFLQQNPPTHLKAEIMVLDDPSVAAGGCVVETDSGLIDASFHTRLTILKELFGAYHPQNTGPKVWAGERVVTPDSEPQSQSGLPIEPTASASLAAPEADTIASLVSETVHLQPDTEVRETLTPSLAADEADLEDWGD